MFLQLYNLTGSALVLPNVGTFDDRATVQYKYGINPAAILADGGNIGEVLRRAKAAGNIDYNLVLDQSDYGTGLVGVKTLVADIDRGAFTTAGLTETVTDDTPLPAGAMLLQAHMDVHTVVGGGTIATAVASSGYTGSAAAFDPSENVAANATRRQLTTLAVGSDISGKYLCLAFTTTVGNVSEATTGNVELAVTYIVVPTL